MSTKYAGYALADEWKDHRSGKYRYKALKKGRSVFGEFRDYGSGLTVYLAARVDGEQVYSRQGAWALDRSLDFFLKIVRPKFIGVAVSKDAKTRSIAPKKVARYFMMRTDDYFTHRRMERWDFTGHLGAKRKGGSCQWLIDPMFMHERSMLSEAEEIDMKLKLPTK